jgi:hypothetical protein
MRAFDEAGCVEVVSEPRLVGALSWKARQGQVTCRGSPRVRTSKGQIVRNTVQFQAKIRRGSQLLGSMNFPRLCSRHTLYLRIWRRKVGKACWTYSFTGTVVVV